MEVESPSLSPPLRPCRTCGVPLEPTGYSSVCATCFTKESQLPSENQPDYWAAGDQKVPDPDSPPWGIKTAIGAWAFHMAATLVIPLIAGFIWLAFQATRLPAPSSPDEAEFWKARLMAMSTSPDGLLVQIIATVPAEIATLGLCWAIVTRIGKRPFFETLGWKWTLFPVFSRVAPLVNRAIVVILALVLELSIVSKLGRNTARARTTDPSSGTLIVGAVVVAVVAIAVFLLLTWLQRDPNSRPAILLAKATSVAGVCLAVFVLGFVLEKALPDKQNTAFEVLINSSRQARIWIALLAVFAAPIVEEVIYRGLLYSALLRPVGLNGALAIAGCAFAVVHFPQYWGAWSGLAGLTLLSFVLTAARATTKSLLPCIAIHTLNNVAAAIQLLYFK